MPTKPARAEAIGAVKTMTQPTQKETSSGNRVRRLPPVCALVALCSALIGRLRFEHRYVGENLVMENGRQFRVFRHLSLRAGSAPNPGSPTVLVVRFRFARFSQALNKLLSLIPIPLIAGYPGFRHKLWMANDQTGCWQGVYEWESAEAVQAYRTSFVLRLMNRRAVSDSIAYRVMEETHLADFVNEGTNHESCVLEKSDSLQGERR